MTVQVRCPQCGAGQDRIYYVRNVTEYYDIEAVHKDGFVDIGGCSESSPHDDYHLYCRECYRSFSVEDIPTDEGVSA